MKAVILAGGFGTRISEESQFKPKPMLEIGEMPILWHIMKLYSHYGVNEFVICAGYKQHVIKEWCSTVVLGVGLLCGNLRVFVEKKFFNKQQSKLQRCVDKIDGIMNSDYSLMGSDRASS